MSWENVGVSVHTYAPEGGRIGAGRSGNPGQPTHHSEPTGRGYAVDCTHERPICEQPAAVNHTGGDR